MDSETLFCWVMTDLGACIGCTWHYHQLRIAGILRLLLLDTRPLVHQVNQSHRLKWAFVHGPEATASFPPTSEESEHDGVRFAIPELDPARLKGPSPTTSDFDGWLRVGALRVDANVWSVKDFIQQMAQVQGLSHAGKPTAATEKDLLTARQNPFRRIDNLGEPHLDLLRQIGRVTYIALQPLFAMARVTREKTGQRYPIFDYNEGT